MRRSTRLAGRFLAAVVLVAAGTAGWTTRSDGQPAGVDPQAQQLLRKMADYLAGLKQFRVETRNTIEAVLDSGQKLQFDNEVTLSVQRPNKLFARRTGDLVNQVFYYDGKTLSLYNPEQKYYANVPAPGTLEETLDFARTSLDVIAPGGDLLYRNAYEIFMADVVAGFVVGKGVVAGVRCDHLAFRNADVDWQIWIQEGAQPLPRKLVITSKQVAGSPEFAVVMTKWNTSPKLADGLFAFKPPKDAKRIDFLRLTAGGDPAQPASKGGK